MTIRNISWLIGWVLLSFLAGAIGSQYTPGSWYAAPVWTMLYLMMGVAAWLACRRGGAG